MHFEVRSDQDSVRWMLNIETQSERLARWKLRIQEFDYEVIYRPGIKHIAPDGLSRLDTDGQDESELGDDILVMALTKSDEKTLNTFNEDYTPPNNLAGIRRTINGTTRSPEKPSYGNKHETLIVRTMHP